MTPRLPHRRRVRGARAALLAGALAAGLSLAQDGAAPVRTPFPDVAPCHWAAAAVARIAGEPEVDPARARASLRLAENALRQVFEGLRCDDLAWSARFLSGVPSGVGPRARLESYALRDVATRLDGDRGEIAFTLVARLDGAELRRAGRAELEFDGRGWRVRYDSLAALDTPLFP